ncbi:hypothetical protein SAMN05444412_10430 [Rhodonellum ikkaensis]|uniref:Uncharacterized protein n=1 Tax=Rhodonellum ikkaensis TaxID=336829 RepID=A0A1H3P2Q5_9BACT|nr:hypothetical protein SAMN05444412_10430 [Rhodonellum ikkaensis]
MGGGGINVAQQEVVVPVYHVKQIASVLLELERLVKINLIIKLRCLLNQCGFVFLLFVMLKP